MDTVVIIKPYFKGLSFNLSSIPGTTINFSNSFFFSRFKFFNKKPKRAPIAVSSSNPIKPSSNRNQPIITPNPETSSIAKWVSGFGDSETVLLEDLNGDYLQNGGLGMAILSVKSSAEGKISPILATLAANPTFVSGFFAWAIAQSAKVILNFFVERKWDLKIMFASGGMPSSHSALCTAMTTSVARCHGVADSLFPVCLGFSLIVMYDAIGVRRHAGMQAEVLNLIVEDLFQGHPISKRKLKELLGHTPSQVIAGALLGIVVACFCCRGCLVVP